MRIGLDCRELTKKKGTALGSIVRSLMGEFDPESLWLLSDVPLAPDLVPEGAHVCSMGKSNPGGFGVVPYHLWLSRTVRRLGLDVFYEVDHYCLFRSPGVTRVTTIHDTYVLEGFEPIPLVHRLAYRVFIMATLRNSDVVSTVSHFTARRVREIFGTRRELPVWPVGIDEPGTVGEGYEPLIPGQFMLSLGRINHWKGTLRIAQIFESELLESPYKMVFAGRCDPDSAAVGAELTEICRRSGDRIIWLDYVDDDAREWLLQNASLLLYGARYDGYGMPPLEAAIRNTPCLMNDIPVLREVTAGLGTYVDFYEDSPGRIAAAALELAEAGGMGDQTQALHRLATERTWSKFAKEIVDVVHADDITTAGGEVDGVAHPSR